MKDITENGKYYVPTLEEFHVGFECEMQDISPPEWYKDVISDHHSLVLIKKWLEQGDVRVKHLDHDDIMQLEWRVIDGLSDHYEKGTKGGVFLMINDWKNRQVVIESVHIFDSGYRTSPTIFRGNLRNKSELKTLMRQLGLIESSQGHIRPVLQ